MQAQCSSSRPCQQRPAAVHRQSRGRTPQRSVQAAALWPRGDEQQSSIQQAVLCGLLAAAIGCQAAPALAAARLPPIDSDPKRCERAYVGNTLGMANAVSDKVLDLRQCEYKGKNLEDKVLSGALVANASFEGANMRGVTLTKAYAVDANFRGVCCCDNFTDRAAPALLAAAGADLTNAVVDRVDFRRAVLEGVKFENAVITGANFAEAKLEGADFTDSLIGSEDYKQLCLNPTVNGETRDGIGCKARKP